jgi:pilus assembly protein CpaB
MQKKFLFIIIGVVLAGLAAFLTVNYISQREKEIEKAQLKKLEELKENQIGIAVATKDIPSGTPITPDSVDKAVISKDQAPANSILELNQVIGKISIVPIRAGQAIGYDILRDMEVTESGPEKSLALLIPEGTRAIPVNAENAETLLNVLKPGDHVDVMGILPGSDGKGMITVTLFENVLVLAVGDELGRLTQDKNVVQPSAFQKMMSTQAAKQLAKKESTSKIITLALPPAESNIVLYVQEQGKIKLLVRGPRDNSYQPQQSITPDTFFEFLVARGAVKPPPPPPPAKAEVPTVEIYRGLNKETVELK